MAEPGERDTPVSLHGLDPIEALRALLAVDPDSEPDVDASERPKGEDPP